MFLGHGRTPHCNCLIMKNLELSSHFLTGPVEVFYKDQMQSSCACTLHYRILSNIADMYDAMLHLAPWPHSTAPVTVEYSLGGAALRTTAPCILRRSPGRGSAGLLLRGHGSLPGPGAMLCCSRCAGLATTAAK